jgi:hypothetical protein
MLQKKWRGEDKMKIKILILCFPLLACILDAKEYNDNYSIEPYAVISDTKMISEGSTLVKSKKYNVFWTLNDSGDTARIFAVDFNGNIVKPEWSKKYSGIKIVDASNIDWEAMTTDESGNLIIADTGNNRNNRTDLAIYKISEPNPYYTTEQGIIAKYLIKYPDQNEFPPDSSNMNYDAEAVFSYHGRIHLISKNRSTPVAKVYVFNSLTPWSVNVPDILTRFDFKSMVTDASISSDGKYLAVLTYNYIWLFETDNSDNPFTNDHYFKAYSLGQCEGITFLDDATLAVSNEEGKLFKIKIADIIQSK